jgi:hypothetical protein
VPIAWFGSRRCFLIPTEADGGATGRTECSGIMSEFAPSACGVGSATSMRESELPCWRAAGWAPCRCWSLFIFGTVVAGCREVNTRAAEAGGERRQTRYVRVDQWAAAPVALKLSSDVRFTPRRGRWQVEADVLCVSLA